MPQGYIFVTVGTTNFDALVRVADSERFAAAASAAGYSGVLVQRGAGAYVPCSARATEGTDPAPQGAAQGPQGPSQGAFWVRHYTFKASLRADMERAALVVSHAGAGSVLEAADLRKPLVVVVNGALMDNHQLELARKAAELERAALVMDPEQLPEALSRAPQPPPAVAGHNFSLFLDDCVWKLGIHKGTRPASVKTMVVLGSGGHTTEMARCVAALDCGVYKPRTYVLAATDRMSTNKLHHLEDTKGGLEGRDFVAKTVPRSREVGQSYFSSIWTTIVAFFYSLALVWATAPDLILCNGPGTCVPIVVAAWIIRAVTRRRTRMVYVESIARVNTLSLSGKVLRRLVDAFVVQWPELWDRDQAGLVLRNFFFPL
eukprot:m51a1_g4667 putative udp-n-acetylglucosamine transferase subunit (374) ;mRNA; r:104942-106605